MSQEIIALDYETYYDAHISIGEMGSHHYVRNGGEPYMVSLVGDGWEWVGHPKDAPWDRLIGAQLVAHNASFDATVTQYLREIGVVPPGVNYQDMDCTADLAAYLQMPRNLKGACEQMLGGYEEIDKSMRNYAKGKRWEDMPADRQAAMSDYALKDSRACRELWVRYSGQWPATERETSRATRRMLWRGIKVNTDLLKTCLSNTQELLWEAEQSIPWGDHEPLLSKKAFDAECRRHNLDPPASLAKDNPDVELWMDSHSEEYPWIKAVSTYRRVNTLLSKLKSIEARVRDDGRISTDLKYFGAAATGRWSGAGGVNLQNLPRGEMFGVDLRRLLIPEEGHRFVTCDLNAIEPRCAALITGDEPMLDMLRNGEDVYQAYAMLNLGFTGANLAEEDPNLRSMCKVALLSSAYGTGHKKLAATSHIYGLNLSLDEARRMVDEYRSTNVHVVRRWDKLNRFMMRAMSQAQTGGQENVLKLPLHSGRFMHYFNIGRAGGLQAETTKGSGRKFYWYGSKLFQGLCQATARDVFADTLLRVEQAGLNPVLHVHDEIITEVPTGDAEEALHQMKDLMAQPPSWAPDLPLAASGYISEHYKK